MANEQTPAKRAHQEDEAEKDKSPKRPCYNYNELIKVLVGPQEQCFTIHKAAICAKSKFFQAACSEHWREGQEKVVRLPDVEPEIFQLYADWAYADTLGSTIEREQSSSPLIKLHLLGDVLDDIKLRNETMQAIGKKKHERHKNLGPDLIRLIYKQTTPVSLLRKWVVHATIYRSNRTSFAKDLEDFPPNFVADVALKLMQQTERDTMGRDAFLKETSKFLEKIDDA